MIRVLTIDELVKSLAEMCRAEGVSLLVLTERQGETEDDSHVELSLALRQDVDATFHQLCLDIHKAMSESGNGAEVSSEVFDLEDLSC
jgi:hypothetical protein